MLGTRLFTALQVPCCGLGIVLSAKRLYVLVCCIAKSILLTRGCFLKALVVIAY